MPKTNSSSESRKHLSETSALIAPEEVSIGSPSEPSSRLKMVDVSALVGLGRVIDYALRADLARRGFVISFLRSESVTSSDFSSHGYLCLMRFATFLEKQPSTPPASRGSSPSARNQ